MSVSITHSPPCCSHPSSPASCSPSPSRIESPGRSRVFGSIPRSSAVSPLPFVLSSSRRGRRNSENIAATSPLVQVDAGKMTRPEDLPAMGFLAEPPQSPSATSATSRFLRTRKSFSAIQAKAALLRESKNARKAAPSPQQHRIQERSSSGSEAENEVEMGESSSLAMRMRMREQSRPKRQSSVMLRDGEFSARDEVDDIVPSPRRRGRARRSHFPNGLASHFETKVSMTPPARLQNTTTKSPFASFTPPDAPATDTRHAAIPRSRAFGPFTPLQDASNTEDLEVRPFSSVPMRRSVGLHPAPMSKSSQVAPSKPALPSLATTLDLPKDRKMALRADSIEELSPRPRRRRMATSPAAVMREPRHFRENVEMSSSPPTPSPGDVSFPMQDVSGYTVFGSAASEIDEDEEDEDASILRPGVFVPTRRAGGARSLSSAQAAPPRAAPPAYDLSMGRSLTTSSIEEQPSSMLAPLSAARSEGKCQHSSPFKTPSKRRTRQHTSSASRSRLATQASPIAVPLESEEGSIFGSASGSSLARDKSMPEVNGLSAFGSRDGSFRSLGSGSQTSPRSFATNSSAWETPGASTTFFTPSYSLSQHTRRVSGESSNLSDTPSHVGFDDSGVAFVSPALSQQSYKRMDGRLHAFQAFQQTQSIDHQSSPSKFAALRRKSVEPSMPTKPRGTHAFSVRERSALANEALWSDGDSSAASTPNVQRSVSATTSAPEGLASPDLKGSAGGNTLERSPLKSVASSREQHASYFTPQPYKSVVPLQTAFMSTGLASKRNKATLNDVNPATGEAVPNLPTRLNYGAARGHVRASSGNMAASLGLRDVVAAANAHAAASSLANTSHTMPDTPMKKPSASFGGHKLVERAPAPSLGSTMLGKGAHPFSPSSNDGSESTSNSGGESPLMNQACESPTLGMSSNTSMRMANDSPSTSMLELVANHASGKEAMSKLESASPDGRALKNAAAARRAAAHMSMPTEELTAGTSLRNALPQRPVSLMRPPLGLQRKSSFGANSEQANALAGHSTLPDVTPSTPTRGNVHIKWYEAAQLVSTPSPTHRAGAREKKRDSWQMGSLRTKGIRPLSGSRNSAVVTSLGTPRQLKPVPSAARRSFYETNFNVLSTLGRGEFSQVDKAEDKRDGCFYAVKRMKRPYVGPRDRLRRLEEVDVLRLLNRDGGHLNIVSFIDSWEESGHLFIQTELCPCVDFASFLQHFSNMGGSLDEARLWKVFREMAHGLRFIHEKGVLHLDIKPANIFITEIATLKIGDFGFATRWPQADSATILSNAGLNDEEDVRSEIASLPRLTKSLEREGDREYIAPEIIADGEYGKAADIFSLGLVLLEAAGDVNLPDNGEAWHKLRSNDLSDVDLSELSISLIRLIERCLCAAPKERASIEEICEHPVLRAVGNSVAQGVQVSELDQLPIFDLPNTESSRSLSKMRPTQSLEGDTAMAETGADECEAPPQTPTMPIAMSLEPPANADYSQPLSGGVAMERKSSAGSALGLEGLEDGERVLDVRGALIHEDLDFLLSILEAEPDVDARLTQGALLHSSQRSSVVIPTISIDNDEGSDETQIFALSPQSKQSHIPSRASPLRHAVLDHNDMDLDG